MLGGFSLFISSPWISQPTAFSSTRTSLSHLRVCSHLPYSVMLAIHTWPVKSHSLHRGSLTRHSLFLLYPFASVNFNWPNNESITISLACSKQMGYCNSLSFHCPYTSNPVTAVASSIYLWGTPSPSVTCLHSPQIKMVLLGPSHSQCPKQFLSFASLYSQAYSPHWG